MKHICILFFIGVLHINAISAQNNWTLEECTRHALQNNIELLKLKGKQTQQTIKHDNLKRQWLPAAEIAATQKFDFGRSLTRENTYQDVNSRISTFSINAEIPIFKGFENKHAIQEAYFNIKSSEENIEAKKEELILQTANLFFRVMIYKDILAITQQQKELTSEQLLKAQTRVDAGMDAASVLADIKAQLAQDELAIVEAKGNEETALIELAQLMNLSTNNRSFNIVYTEDKEETDTSILFYSSTFHPLQAAIFQLNSLKENRRKICSGYYPSLSLGASTGSNYYLRNGTENEVFAKQFKNNLQTYVYATLRIPLFDRFATRDNARIAQIEILNQELTLKEIETELAKEQEKAKAELNNAHQRFSSATEAAKAANISFNHATERFSAGRIAAYEYLQAKQKMANTQSQVSQAKYNLLFKKKIMQYYNRITN